MKDIELSDMRCSKPSNSFFTKQKSKQSSTDKHQQNNKLQTDTKVIPTTVLQEIIALFFESFPLTLLQREFLLQIIISGLTSDQISLSGRQPRLKSFKISCTAIRVSIAEIQIISDSVRCQCCTCNVADLQRVSNLQENHYHDSSARESLPRFE